MGRKRYRSKPNPRGQTPDRAEIQHKFKRVKSRAFVVDREGDTVMGRPHRGAIIGLDERKSGFSLAAKVQSKDAGEISSALIHLLAPYRFLAKTGPFDNG